MKKTRLLIIISEAPNGIFVLISDKLSAIPGSKTGNLLPLTERIFLDEIMLITTEGCSLNYIALHCSNGDIRYYKSSLVAFVSQFPKTFIRIRSHQAVSLANIQGLHTFCNIFLGESMKLYSVSRAFQADLKDKMEEIFHF